MPPRTNRIRVGLALSVRSSLRRFAPWEPHVAWQPRRGQRRICGLLVSVPKGDPSFWSFGQSVAGRSGGYAASMEWFDVLLVIAAAITIALLIVLVFRLVG